MDVPLIRSAVPTPRHPQRGVSLLTTLIMLIMIMLLGVAAVQLSRGELTLSGNLQFKVAAFNEAEAAVSTAEKWLGAPGNYKSAGFDSYNAGTGLFPIGYMTAQGVDPLTMSWTDSNSLQAGNAKQRYLIEGLARDKSLPSSGLALGGRTASGCNKVNTYRVIGRGESQRGATEFIQTVFSVLSC